jgi:uncharacterized protein YbaP (TraB family)
MAMLERFRRGGHWLAAAAALALAGCAGAPAEAPAAGGAGRPAMWRVADADTTVYLFGTIHMLPEGRQWRTPAFDAALAAADELVLEVAEVDDPMAAAQGMMKLGLGQGLPPLRERVPEDKRAALDAMVAESGVPIAVLDRLETWAASLSLLGVTFKRLGLDPELGVERRITAGWKAGGKPVRGLETIEEQFGFFDTLAEDQQRAFLVGVLDSPEDAREQFQAMLDAWASGDVAGVARTFDDEANMSPELRAVLLGRRNARWAEWLDKRMDQPGTVFVAVGAGHLAGADSVQKLLGKYGHKAKRVQ